MKYSTCKSHLRFHVESNDPQKNSIRGKCRQGKKCLSLQPIDQAAEVIMQDHTHLDNNPIPITRDNVIYCLEKITKVNPLA